MRQDARVIIPLLILSASGCVRISVTSFGSPAYSAVPIDSVRVFATIVPEAYTELAVLRAQRFLAQDTKVLTVLRERASRIGANGILLLNARGAVTSRGSGTGVVVGGPNDWSVFVGQMNTDVDEFQRAVAIHWTPSASTSRSQIGRRIIP